VEQTSSAAPRRWYALSFLAGMALWQARDRDWLGVAFTAALTASFVAAWAPQTAARRRVGRVALVVLWLLVAVLVWRSCSGSR